MQTAIPELETDDRSCAVNMQSYKTKGDLGNMNKKYLFSYDGNNDIVQQQL